MPVKFDDLSKVAKSVLGDEYLNMDRPFQFKAKQRIRLGTVTTTVDLNQKDGNATSGVVSWKLPNPLGINGLTIDKLEYNKSGGMKFEGFVNKSIHKVDGLSVDFKTDLTDPLGKLKTGCTYTGLADTRVRFETEVLKPASFKAEVTRVQGPATIGAKVAGTNVDVGLRASKNGVFGSLVITKNFQAVEGTVHYKLNKALEVVAIANKNKSGASAEGGVKYALNDALTLHGKVTNTTKGGVGAEGGVKYVMNDALTMKAKTTAKGVVTAHATYKPARGFTVNYGASVGKDVVYGVHLDIE